MKKSKNYEIRTSTKEELDKFCSDQGFVPTVISRTIVIDGKPEGCGGIFRDEGRWYAFANFSDKARQHPVALIRATKSLLDYVDSLGIRRIYNQGDLFEPTAHRFATAFGFMPLRGNLYVRE